jgi:PTS system nitrogen regulatory IIA component
MHFGATLRLLRTTAGVSLRGLAAEIGVSPAYLSRVEHGHDLPPTPDRIRAIARALGVADESLLDLVDELRPDSLAWLGRTPAGRRLAAELRRRRLSPAQLARVLAFVQDTFGDRDPGDAAELLAADRVVLGVDADRVREALDLAALRLGGAHVPDGDGAVGGGLWLASIPGDEAAALVVIPRGISAATPDGRPIRAVLVVRGGGPDRLARAARLADPALLDALATETSPEAAVERIRTFEPGRV